MASRIGIDSAANTIERKAELKIIVDGGDGQVYSTRETITGLATLEHDNDAIIADLTLTLEGATATNVGNTSDHGPASGKVKGRHHFLKLQHPVDVSLLSSEVLEEGRSRVQIPFTFLVPERLLPGACAHTAISQDIKTAHLLLPPTLEDDHYAKGVQLARISYAVRARASLFVTSTEAVQNVSVSAGVRIVPVREEHPPQSLYEDQEEYQPHQSISIKSALRKSLGKLTAEVDQPPCLHLNNQRTQEETISTPLRLKFASSKGLEQTPDITGITTALLEYTFFAATPFESLPRSVKAYAKAALQKGYVEEFTLSSRKLSKLEWTKHLTNPVPGGEDCSSPTLQETQCHAVSILMPITLLEVRSSKGAKTFPPSFDSCLVSRTHAIRFEIHIKNNPSITLTTPIQLVARSLRESTTSPSIPAAVLVDIERVFSFEDDDRAPIYEDLLGQQSLDPSQPEEEFSRVTSLPEYVPDVDQRTGQAQPVPANRHSISTTYEVPQQEWQNIGTGIRWVYRKAKAIHQQRRLSKG